MFSINLFVLKFSLHKNGMSESALLNRLSLQGCRTYLTFCPSRQARDKVIKSKLSLRDVVRRAGAQRSIFL